MKSSKACPETAASFVRRGKAELVSEFADRWQDLLERSANEPFYGPDWVGAYLRAFAPPGEVVLFTVTVGDRLDAILPLVSNHSPFCGIPAKKLAAATNVHGCRFDLSLSAAGRIDAVHALWSCIRREEWDVIELTGVPDGGSVDLLLDIARQDGFLTGKWESFKSPLVPLAGVADAKAIPRSSHFRQNLNRRRRKAEALGPLRLSRFDTPDPVALDKFFQLEKSGWKGQLGTAIGCSEETRRFYTDIAFAAARRGYFSLYLLEFGDTLMAGHFGLTYRNRYYTPKVAYDEKYAVYGPGHILMSAVLQDCIERRLEEFDFLGPVMDWKSEWATGYRPHSDCYIFRHGLFGQALHAAKFQLMATLRKAARTPAISALRRRFGW